MPGLFTEATRVQLTAIQHLARIGYTYLGKISESGASSSGTSAIFDSEKELNNKIALNKKMNQKPDAKAKVIFDRRMKLVEKSNRLTKLRDKLLPLLMNGQVVVG